MILKDESVRFEKSLNLWTLSFKDQEAETNFLTKFHNEAQPNLGYKICFYSVMMFLFTFRILKIIYTIAGVSVKTGTLAEEISITVLSFSILIIEGILYYFNLWPKYRGCILYTTFPIHCVYSAFFTQNNAVFGITYF